MIQDEDWIRRLPKAVSHVHLEGSVPAGAIAQIVARAGGDPRFESAEAIARYWRFDDELRSREGFMERWAWKTAFFRDPESYAIAAEAAARALVSDGVVYAEWLIAASDVAHHGLSAADVLRGAAEGLARVPELESRLVLDVVADAGTGAALEALESAQGAPLLVGVHIGGHASDPADFEVVARFARDRHLQVSARLDDDDPRPLDLWAPDRVVGLARVAPGSALWARFAQERRPLLFTPRTDIALGDATLHPVEHALEREHLASVQPDAWQLSGGGIVTELAALRSAGHGRDVVRRVLQASVTSAFLPYRARRQLLGDALEHDAWFEDVPTAE